MQTFPNSETVLLSSNSPPVLNNPGDDVDIDFGDVFGGPPKRRSKVNEVKRHSFNETALRRRDVIVDDGVMIPRDEFWDGKDEKPVFGEEPLIRRRFTADDFYDDIFRVNEKNESSLPSSRILSPTHKPESPATLFPVQYSSGLAAKLIKTTEIGLSKNKETTSSKSDKISPDSYVNVPEVLAGKTRQFHFSIYKWPNKGVPVIIWGSSRLSSMAKSEETTKNEKGSKGEESSLSGFPDQNQTTHKSPGLMSEQAISSDGSKMHEAIVKPLHSFSDRQGEDIVTEKEVKKGKSKGKNTRNSTGESRNKKKPQGKRSSLYSPIPDIQSSSAPEVDKGKVKDFVKIFSQGASSGGNGDSLGQSSRWRAKETHKTESVKIPDQEKKSIPVNQDFKPSSQANSKDSDQERMNYKKASGVFEKEERYEPRRVFTTTEDIDEPFHVNFLVEEITEDENKLEKTQKEAEEIQNIDAKIRKWSSGKTGNIRSLLSTLQYILWSGSGWKAVPLMDMIEGNAVRRSYQKALLILHPDKLQQKGASANQKYMADKVFELLQEAWDHFNTLGPV